MVREGLLPVHGFVLAGGKSSRMGVDKASLEFRGRPMVEIAVEKLRLFCADVSIVGNREDLSGFAEVVREERVDCGPAAGIEAGLLAARREWVMFVPVDVPLVPAELLRRWVESTVSADQESDAEALSNLLGAYLYIPAGRQPAFCMLRRGVASVVAGEIDRGERRLEGLFSAISARFGVASMVSVGATVFAPVGAPTKLDIETWFLNVNTPEDLAAAEAWAEGAQREL